MYCILDVMSDCSERVPYNTPNHPVHASRSWLSVFRNMECASHWHDDLEFGLVLSGHMAFSVNGETVKVTSGQGIFINSRQLHHNFSQDGSDSEYICVLIHPSLLCANDYLKETYVMPITDNCCFPYILLDKATVWQGRLMKAVRDIWQAFEENGKTLGLTLQSLSYLIASLLYEHMPQVEKRSARAALQLASLRNMVGYVQRHYDEKITLRDIAAAGSMSESSCCAVFGKHLHQSPIGYLTRYRLEKAMELLKNPSLSVTEVALAVGFAGSSYFTESFKKHHGLTPTEYRRRSDKIFTAQIL